MMRYLSAIVLVAILSFVVLGCGEDAATGDRAEEEGKGPVTVASMIDAEGAILGQMMVIMLEQDGFEVEDETEFGTPDTLRGALTSGEVDLVLDYTGSGQYYHDVEDTDPWSDAEAGYRLTRELDAEENDIYWLTPAPANNTEMLAVRRDFAEEHDIRNMYDFAEYVNSGGEVKLICSASFAENVKGLLGYEEAYGFSLAGDQVIQLSAGNTAEMLKALVEGTNGVNVSLVYGTDGALEQMDLVVIEDAESVPPVYLPTPVLRGELHEQYPEIAEILAPVFETLTLETLQDLNAQVAYEGRDAEGVAREYLEENGFIEK
ncbi:MAG: glycine betaine ABC transporter substrate-binding protein [Clostridia bacterium]